MKSAERIVIYAALVVMAGINLVLGLSQSGRAAFAEAAAWLESLGPADSLILTDNDNQLVIRNKAGRIAWGDNDFRQTYTVAFVDIGKALNPLLESSQFVEERDALRQELEATEKDFQTRLQALGEEIRGLDRTSPEAQEKMQQYQQLYAEYNKWGQEVAIPRRDELDIKHLQQAYKEMTSAVNVVADKMGIDIVLRFIPTEQEFRAQTAEQAMSEIRLRSAVKYPERLDITSEVMEELSLETEE